MSDDEIPTRRMRGTTSQQRLRLVEVVDGGLELRWTWLPYWLGANERLKKELEAQIRQKVLVDGLSQSSDDLDTLHLFVCEQLQARFPALPGLGSALKALGHVYSEPMPSRPL